MRGLAGILGLLLLAVPHVLAEDDDDPIPVQRYLESLRLGDYLKEIKIVYPPLREWPSYREPGGLITRYHIERAYAKHFPWNVDVLRLGIRWGRLVHIQAVYSERYAKEKPLEQMVLDLSMMYGEPRRKGMVYAWSDGRTVIRAFNEEMPSPDGKAIEMRPTLELFERGVRREID